MGLFSLQDSTSPGNESSDEPFATEVASKSNMQIPPDLSYGEEEVIPDSSIGIRKLYVAVFETAFSDLNSKDPYKRTQAIEWFTGQQPARITFEQFLSIIPLSAARMQRIQNRIFKPDGQKKKHRRR